MTDWLIEPGRGGGTLEHQAPPRFTAAWIIGDDPDALAAIQGPCWSDEGSGEDAIHLHGFRWRDPPPDPAEFQALMHRAVRAIDAWIAARL